MVASATSMMLLENQELLQFERICGNLASFGLAFSAKVASVVGLVNLPSALD